MSASRLVAELAAEKAVKESRRLVAGLQAEAAAKDRRSGVRRVLCDPETFTPDWVAWWPGRVFLGVDSAHIERRHLKYVSRLSPYAPFTPGELARLWLRRVMAARTVRSLDAGRRGLPLRFMPDGLGRDDVAAGGQLDIPPALHFDPPADRGGDWVYLDVSACYWRVFSVLPLDFPFVPPAAWPADSGECGHVWLTGEERAGMLGEKRLRNAVWGMLRSGALSWYHRGELVASAAASGGPFVSPGLVGAVMATVHAAATEAVEAGAVMWLTDAAICRPERVKAVAGVLRRRWGLPVVTKLAGPGHLWALNDYQVAGGVTGGGHVDRGPVSTLLPATAAERDRLAALRAAAFKRPGYTRRLAVS